MVLRKISLRKYHLDFLPVQFATEIEIEIIWNWNPLQFMPEKIYQRKQNKKKTLIKFMKNMKIQIYDYEISSNQM